MSIYIFACLYPKLYKKYYWKELRYNFIIAKSAEALFGKYSQSIDYSNCDIKQNWTRIKIILWGHLLLNEDILYEDPRTLSRTLSSYSRPTCHDTLCGDVSKRLNFSASLGYI